MTLSLREESESYGQGAPCLAGPYDDVDDADAMTLSLREESGSYGQARGPLSSWTL